MTPEIEALIATGAATLVTAVATDAWKATAAGFRKLFGRGDAGAETKAGQRLQASATVIEGAEPGQQLTVRQREENVWRVRLTDLVDNDPAALDELRALVSEIVALLPAERGWVQHNTASDHAHVYAALNGNVIIHRQPPTSD